MAIVYVAVGSNLGKRFENLKHALGLIRQEPQISFIKASPYYETLPEGVDVEQPKFLNGVWKIQTEWSPQELLVFFQGLEKSMGRERGEKNLPRVIDLDILFYDLQIIEEGNLTIPHPKLHERWLQPVARFSVVHKLGLSQVHVRKVGAVDLREGCVPAAPGIAAVGWPLRGRSALGPGRRTEDGKKHGQHQRRDE